MFNPIVGTRCILQEPGGKETVCRVTSAMIRQCTGCVPELDLTVQIESTPVVHSVPPWERKMTIEPFAPIFIEPPELRYVFRHDAKYKAKQVIFNPPATVVLWTDGTKTVVKCDPEDTYDKRTGLALCYMKKALGNKSRDLNKALKKAEVD